MSIATVQKEENPMFRKMPFILIFTILAVLWLSPYLSLKSKEILYALSLTIKSGIVMLLPLVIFSLLYKTVVGLAHRATAIIAVILICVCCSNFISTFLSHYVGSWVYQRNLSLVLPKTTEGLAAAWLWQFPKLIANNKAMFLGIILGILFGALRPTFARALAHRLNQWVMIILKGFVFIIPFFVIGFVVKLQNDGVVQVLFKDYAMIFAVIALAQYSYVLLLYVIFNHFNLRQAFLNVKNMLPAAITGFSTMSSAAAMPLTILGAENNVYNKDLVRAIIPATVNIHLIGDCFAIPIFAFAILKSFGMPEPTLFSYLIFMCYFVLAKFSVAAIPAGGIIVMLPVLETYLGFNANMLSLITALYILFDPIVTSANILGNGAFAKAIDKLVGIVFKPKTRASATTPNSINEFSA